jgi:hypothetical protein
MKKNSISGILVWALYTLVASACLFLISISTGALLGLELIPSVACGAAVMALSGLVVYGLHKLLKKQLSRLSQRQNNRSRLVWIIVETLLLLCGLAGMVALRLLTPWDVTGNPVFEAAQVTAEPFAPSMAHGGFGLYLWLLHIVLLLLGNKAVGAVILQMFLFVCAAFCLYFAVRRLSGPIAALIAVAFFGFSPYMVSESKSLSIFMLFVFFYCLALRAIGAVPDKSGESGGKRRWLALILRYLTAGLLIGFCCYLDMTGITLLFFLTGVVCFEDQNPVVSFLSCVLTAALGYVGAHAVQSLVNGGTVLDSICGQAELYLPGSFRIPILVENAGSSWEIIVLAVLFAVGIFSFWCDRRIRDRGMWLSAALLLMGMQCFGMTASEYFDGYPLLFLFLAVLAACGAAALFTIPESGETAPEPVLFGMQGDLNAPTDGSSGAADTQEDALEIHYIENPLPLPKKRERKVMDYDYEVAEDDDFDI